jgi:hypothetical protein
MISFLVGLAVVLAVAAYLSARHYRREHPGESMTQWLDAHHMGWMHHRH